MCIAYTHGFHSMIRSFTSPKLLKMAIFLSHRCHSSKKLQCLVSDVLLVNSRHSYITLCTKERLSAAIRHPPK